MKKDTNAKLTFKAETKIYGKIFLGILIAILFMSGAVSAGTVTYYLNATVE